MMRGGQGSPWRGIAMHYEDTSAKKTQLIALLMTVLLVGGAIVYVL
jgi:hypothetical protein